jgi:peptidoglycan hydrolase-like protein with peptidoglycan-binding domain
VAQGEAIMIIGSFLRRSLVRGGCLTALAAAMLLGAGLPASADYYDAVTAYDRADYAAARAELEPLAAAGDARAQLLLGRMHAAGQGVLQDYVRAHLLLNLAAASGIDGAAAARDELAGRMTPQQIADAQQAAAAWTAAPAAGIASPDSAPLDSQGLIDLQWQLALHGYDPGPADGEAGERTSAAIRRYQADAGLPVDGQPGRALLDLLQYTVPAVRNAAAPAPAAVSQPAVRVATPGPLDSLNPGLKRSYVVGIQQELKARGYDPGPIDGVAGRRTYDAIRRYQRSVGLAVDGQPSPALLNHLKFVGGRVAASN